MSFQTFTQTLFNGFASGWIYILVAVGLTLIFGIMRIVQLAHGEVYMLGAYAAYLFAYVFGLNFFLALVLAALLTGILGLILERGIFRRFRAQEGAAMLIGIGLILILQTTAFLVFGLEEKNIDSPVSGVLQIGGARLAWDRLMAVGVGMAFLAGLYLFIQRTRVGQALRAVAQDQDAAALQGISLNRMALLTMGLGSALAGAAGTLMGALFTLAPAMGTFALTKGIAVIILGGMGSIAGAALGGLLLGFVDAFVPILLGGEFANLAAFGLIIFILIVRPRGFFGHE